jgi:hypothetical protein
MAEKRGRGNPRKPFIGPKLPKTGNLPDPRAPKCGKSYKQGNIEKICGKRGRHLKHGPA